jgi:hypothetical protein
VEKGESKLSLHPGRPHLEIFMSLWMELKPEAEEYWHTGYRRAEIARKQSTDNRKESLNFLIWKYSIFVKLER